MENGIKQLRQFVPRYQQRFRLLNPDGYWIAGEKPEDEWGFVLTDRSDKTMAKTAPELWAKVVRDSVGQEPYRWRLFYLAAYGTERIRRGQTSYARIG